MFRPTPTNANCSFLRCTFRADYDMGMVSAAAGSSAIMPNYHGCIFIGAAPLQGAGGYGLALNKNGVVSRSLFVSCGVGVSAGGEGCKITHCSFYANEYDISVYNATYARYLSVVNCVSEACGSRFIYVANGGPARPWMLENNYWRSSVPGAKAIDQWLIIDTQSVGDWNCAAPLMRDPANGDYRPIGKASGGGYPGMLALGNFGDTGYLDAGALQGPVSPPMIGSARSRGV